MAHYCCHTSTSICHFPTRLFSCHHRALLNPLLLLNPAPLVPLLPAAAAFPVDADAFGFLMFVSAALQGSLGFTLLRRLMSWATCKKAAAPAHT